MNAIAASNAQRFAPRAATYRLGRWWSQAPRGTLHPCARPKMEKLTSAQPSARCAELRLAASSTLVVIHTP